MLTKENKAFAEKLGYPVKTASMRCNNEEEETDDEEEDDDDDEKELPSFENNLSNSSCAKSSLEAVTDSIGKSFQAGILLSLS